MKKRKNLILLVLLPYVSLIIFYLKYIYNKENQATFYFEGINPYMLDIIVYIILGMIIFVWVNVIFLNYHLSKYILTNLVIFIAVIALLNTTLFTGSFYYFLVDNTPIISLWIGVFSLTLIKKFIQKEHKY